MVKEKEKYKQLEGNKEVVGPRESRPLVERRHIPCSEEEVGGKKRNSERYNDKKCRQKQP